MKLSIGVILCLLVVEVNSQGWFQFMKEAGEGARDMWRAYSDMREANWKGSDRYFRARGNFDAAQRGPGGAWAAKVISDAREAMQIWRGRISENSGYYQFPNEWGRSGNNPNIFRPAGLPLKY